MNTIFGLCVGMALFICTIKAYTIGLQHGKQLSQGNIPKVNINPVKTVVEAVEHHDKKKEEEKLSEELSDIMNCSADSMLKAIKKGE